MQVRDKWEQVVFVMAKIRCNRVRGSATVLRYTLKSSPRNLKVIPTLRDKYYYRYGRLKVCGLYSPIVLATNMGTCGCDGLCRIDVRRG
jgi:hypothetical protein